MTEHEKDEVALPIEREEVEASVHIDPAETADENNPKKRKRNWLFISVLVLLIILLLGIGAAGYWFWDNTQTQLQSLTEQQKSLTGQQQSLKSQLEDSQSKISALQKINAQSNNSWQQAVNKLEALVVSSAQRWNQQANRTENRWHLEEALTLTRLAQQRLQLDSSARVAKGLMKSADQILAGLDQAAVLPLRRQLAADVLALETTQAVDINGHYFSLEAMGEQIKTLTWMPKPFTKKDIPENVAPADGFWHSLKQVVVVTKLDVPAEAPAMQSDFERWRQRMLLLVEQTQLALLAHNQPLFDASLKQSIATVDVMASQFHLDAVHSELESLQSAVLNPVWPNINASVNIIEQYLSEQTQAAVEDAE